jgi:peroxiredoxin
MKKVLLILLGSITVISCNKVADNEFIITGKADGIKDGAEIYLNMQDSTGIVHVDTVKVKDGKFEMEGKLKNGPHLHFIQMKDVQGGFPFVLESGEIDIKINKDTIGKSTVYGTYSNDKLTEYTEAYNKINKRMLDFQKTNMSKWKEAEVKKDTVTRNALIKENKKFQEEIKALSIGHIEKYPKSFISVYFLEQFSAQPDADKAKIKKLYEALDPELKKTKPAKNVLKNMMMIEAQSTNGASVGMAAPDFIAPTPEGKPTSLKQSMGKVTLVDFWASWCRPCREESPNVVALYNEFHARGLNIISVSLDLDAAEWKEAIAADKLAWTHVSNLKKWKDPIALQYQVQGIPATYLLDSNGIIVAKGLQGAELKAKVASLLKS